MGIAILCFFKQDPRKLLHRMQLAATSDRYMYCSMGRFLLI